MVSGTLAPTFAGFNTFVYNVMRIDPLALPPSDPILRYAYDISINIVNYQLAGVPGAGGTWSVYALAVYNLAASNLVNYAQDLPGRTFFEDMRDRLGITKFTAGVVSSTSDSGTSVSFVTPDFMRELTLANLQQLKDPWGRTYLLFAQDMGPPWGIS